MLSLEFCVTFCGLCCFKSTVPELLTLLFPFENPKGYMLSNLVLRNYRVTSNLLDKLLQKPLFIVFSYFLSEHVED